jgi:hypothetical protein
LGAGEHENVRGRNRRSITVLGYRLAKIETPAVGSIVERVMVVFVDELVVAPLTRPVIEFLAGEGFSKRVGEIVQEARLGHQLVLLGPPSS